MEILTSIVKNLLLIVVTASFLEILLPDNSMRPFVRFTIGLFVILAILNPILSTFYSDRDLEARAWDLPWQYNETGDFQETGIQVNREIQQAGNDVIKDKIEKQINSLAILVPGVQDLETQVTLDAEHGELTEITLVIEPASPSDSEDGAIEAFSVRRQVKQDQEVIRQKLASMMRNLYGLEGKRVVIKFERG
jgi:stage III sporulation protein AF